MSFHGRVVLAIGAGWLVLDQLTKWLVLNNADRCVNDPEALVWTLRICLTQNTGGAFGLFDGFGPVIAVVVLVIVVFLFRLGQAVSTLPSAVAAGLVLGGAASNPLDRIFRARGFLDGGVVDFIDFQYWPVFNVADVGIVVGIMGLAVLSKGAQPAGAK